MNLTSMRLQNYRCFAELTVHFDDQLTVLVGVNGCGKTAVLDAVAVFLKQYAATYCSYADRYELLGTDIYFDKEQASLTFHTNNIQDAPNKIEFLASKSRDKNFARIKLLDKTSIRILNLASSKNTPLPIACYYPAKRIVDTFKRNNAGTTKLANAFENAFYPKIDFSSSLNWFIEKSVQEALTRDRTKKPYTIPEVTAVKNALVLALLEEYNAPYLDNTPLELFLTRKNSPNIPISFVQLSDGYRTMLAMVMDLARRMAVANAHVNWPEGQNALYSPGIVLIDEIELHLHPSWQQTVLPTLMRIFPMVQFIITTHSPQVVSSVKAKHVRILGEDGMVYTAPRGTWGAEASRIMKQIFGVDNRPPSQARDDLEEYRKLVYDDKWNTERALQLRTILDERYGGQEPELVELDMHIANRTWEMSEEGGDV